MNTKSLIRMSVIIVLSAVAIVGIFSEPAEDSATWLLDFLLSKGIGFAAVYTACRLYNRWSNADKYNKQRDEIA